MIAFLVLAGGSKRPYEEGVVISIAARIALTILYGEHSPAFAASFVDYRRFLGFRMP